MKTSQPVKVGLDAMLTPDNCAVILIDHQPFQVSAVKNIDVALIINNTVMLAKAAKAFNVPTLLTTVVKDRGGNLIKPLQDVFPEQSRSTGPSSTRGRTRRPSSGSRTPAARSS